MSCLWIRLWRCQGNVSVLLTFYECALLRWVAMNEVWVMRLPYFSSKMFCVLFLLWFWMMLLACLAAELLWAFG